ncbi:MAG TPA: YrdB family protein [Gammaproteobacteria bacterium]|jgi:hypothetical protein
MNAVNLLIRFLLELAALVALGYFGYHATQAEPARLVLCIAAPALFAVLWALFASHKAKYPPPRFYKAILGAMLLEVTPVVLFLEGQGVWAAGMAVVIVVNSVLVYWRKYQ